MDGHLIISPSFQLSLQKVLAFIAVICVPIMLFGRPVVELIIYKMKSRKDPLSYSKLEDNDDRAVSYNLKIKDFSEYKFRDEVSILDESGQSFNSLLDSDKEKSFSFGEEMINQGIETIEFVLGSISNTASYLRLWALSLAHNQLAKVFMDMILLPSFAGGHGIFITFLKSIISFVLFFVVTFAVILVMDLMECFLHALRYNF